MERTAPRRSLLVPPSPNSELRKMKQLSSSQSKFADAKPGYMEVKAKMSLGPKAGESLAADYVRHRGGGGDYEYSGRQTQTYGGTIRTQRMPEEWKKKKDQARRRSGTVRAISTADDEHAVHGYGLIIGLSVFSFLSMALLLLILGGVPFVLLQLQEFDERLAWLQDEDRSPKIDNR